MRSPTAAGRLLYRVSLLVLVVIIGARVLDALDVFTLPFAVFLLAVALFALIGAFAEAESQGR